MKIVFRNDPGDGALIAARVARLLAVRAGHTLTRVCLGLQSKAAGGADQNGGATNPQAEAGAIGAGSFGESANAPSPASTRLIVAPRADSGDRVDVEEAARLALATGVPTLAAHQPTRLLSWLAGCRPLRVLCAHDLTTAADDGLHLVKQLVPMGRCEVIVTHVHRSVEQRSHPGCASVGSMRQHDLETRALLERRLREQARRILGAMPVGTRVSHAPFRRDDFILDVILQTNADMVVAPIHPQMGTEEPGQGATISRALLNFATTNVVLVPALASPATAARKEIKRILVVTGLSAADDHAVAHGQALLTKGGALRLLHVIHPDASPGSEYERDLSGGQRWAARSRRVEEKWEELRAVARAASGPRIVVETEVVEQRDRAAAIAQAAERFEADLLCLSLGERPALFTRLFRWQVRTLLATANRPLLIVHPSPA